MKKFRLTFAPLLVCLSCVLPLAAQEDASAGDDRNFLYYDSFELQPGSQVAFVRDRPAALRLGPSKLAVSLITLRPQTRLEVTHCSASWCRVLLREGARPWVHTDDIVYADAMLAAASKPDPIVEEVETKPCRGPFWCRRCRE